MPRKNLYAVSAYFKDPPHIGSIGVFQIVDFFRQFLSQCHQNCFGKYFVHLTNPATIFGESATFRPRHWNFKNEKLQKYVFFSENNKKFQICFFSIFLSFVIFMGLRWLRFTQKLLFLWYSAEWLTFMRFWTYKTLKNS